MAANLDGLVQAQKVGRNLESRPIVKRKPDGPGNLGSFTFRDPSALQTLAEPEQAEASADHEVPQIRERGRRIGAEEVDGLVPGMPRLQDQVNEEGSSVALMLNATGSRSGYRRSLASAKSSRVSESNSSSGPSNEGAATAEPFDAKITTGVRYTIEFGGDPQNVTLTTSGPATSEGFRQMQEELIADPRFHEGMLILADHTNLDVASLSGEEVEEIARGIAGRESGGGSVIAVVAPRPVLYGVNRMSLAFAEPSTLKAEVFYSREEAIAWLRSMRPAN